MVFIGGVHCDMTPHTHFGFLGSSVSLSGGDQVDGLPPAQVMVAGKIAAFSKQTYVWQERPSFVTCSGSIHQNLMRVSKNQA